MKTDENPDADRLLNSKNEEKLLTRTGKKGLTVIPEIKIQRVDEVNDAILNTKSYNAISESNKKIQILVVFPKWNRPRFVERFVECYQESCAQLVVRVLLGIAVIVGPTALGGIALAEYCRKVEYEEELKKIELEKKRQEILNQNTIEWNNAVNSCEH